MIHGVQLEKTYIFKENNFGNIIRYLFYQWIELIDKPRKHLYHQLMVISYCDNYLGLWWIHQKNTVYQQFLQVLNHAVTFAYFIKEFYSIKTVVWL